MNRIIIAKVSEISYGIIFICFGVLLFGLGLIALKYGDKSFLIAFLLSFMAVFSVEMGIFWIKRFYLMQGGLKITPPKRFIAKTANVLVPFIFVKSMITVALALVGFLVAEYFVIKYFISGFNQIDFAGFIFLIALLLFYVLIRLAFGQLIKEYFIKLSNKFSGQMPTVELSGENLILHLGAGYVEKYRDLKIPLAEIDDIKILDRYQGLALVKYVLGPDVEFGVKTISDKIAYQQGKIERPNYFAYMENQSGGKNLFLQGPELLYLVGVGDGDDLQKIVKLKQG
ncbi:hypothetical protein KKG46_00270 [Patescibacteria group bacterium]|nr:hypothetical protein [Patescibacteria group bacterium]